MPDWKRLVRKRLESVELNCAGSDGVVEELAAHLEDRYRDLLAAGHPEEEAERRALAELGDLSELSNTDALRDAKRRSSRIVPGKPARGNPLAVLGQDLRYGVRVLARRPGFTAIAALTLALGIGSNTAIFTLFNAVFLRSLPVESPQDLVAFDTAFSYPDFTDLRDGAGVFSGLVAHTDLRVAVDDGKRTERMVAEVVSENYFDVLGVRARLGRTFASREPEAVAVLSHAAWMKWFGGDPGVIGRQLRVNAQPATVIGIAPSGCNGTVFEVTPELWIPMSHHAVAAPEYDFTTNRREVWLSAFGRLAPGTSLEVARARTATLAEQIESASPDSFFAKAPPVPVPMSDADSPMRRTLQPVLLSFMAVVGSVLLIACANLANLLLARVTTRRREMAVRQALGASRTRLICQLVVESLLLTILGAAAALLTAPWTTSLVASLLPATRGASLDLRLDGRVVLFMLAISALAAVLFGVAPAIRAAGSGIVGGLKADSGGRAAGRSRLQGSLVVIQVALTVMLLVGSGLFLRTLRRTQAVDPGFDPSSFLTFQINPSQIGYDEARSRDLFRRLRETIAALPGVERVSVAQLVQLGFGNIARPVGRAGETIDADDVANLASYNVVGAGYFGTLGLPLDEGREFGAGDRPDTPRVVIINKTLAQRLWPGESAVGKPLQLPLDEPGPRYEVVGVARDSKYHALTEAAKPYFYLPHDQAYRGRIAFLVRTSPEPRTMIEPIRKRLRELDSGLPAYNIRTYDEYLGNQVALPRATALLSGGFALLSLVLAAVGVYGVISYTVNQRTREIGIRLALGAQRKDVFRIVVGDGMALAVAGLVVGLIVALALSRVVSSLLFGVSPTDPTTFAVVSVVLVVVAFVACCAPAQRAMRTDPVNTLRHE